MSADPANEPGQRGPASEEPRHPQHDRVRVHGPAAARGARSRTRTALCAGRSEPPGRTHAARQEDGRAAAGPLHVAHDPRRREVQVRVGARDDRRDAECAERDLLHPEGQAAVRRDGAKEPVRAAGRRPPDAAERVQAVGRSGVLEGLVLRELRAGSIAGTRARDPRAAGESAGARGARRRCCHCYTHRHHPYSPHRHH